MASPNIIAFMMLFVWPLVCWQLWRRLDPARALIWTVLGGYLIMPPLTVINFPIIPDLDKTTIPNLMAWVGALYVRHDKISFLPEGRIGKVLILIYIISPFGTVLTNTDPIYFGAAYLQGMKIYDSAAAVANQFIALLPFLLARRYLGNPAGMRAVIEALVLAGLWYSVPMLIEARFSPQMNVWVYGFFQHDFFQTIRQGGYRPVVFLPHGLWVAFFALMVVLAAMVRLRDTTSELRPKALLIALYLAFMLYVCKSAGVAVYALCLTPLVLLANWRLQVLAAAAIAVLVISYPVLRGLHLVPVEQIVNFANGFSADRAGSLQFRIDNEELLLARAQEKALFGWGGYGRAFLHDPITGQMTTIADGAWVIVMGTYGWMGFIAEFGLTSLPILLLGREALSRYAAPFNRYSAGLALILAANLFDLLPNATHIPFTWLMVGGLLAEAERMRQLRLDAQRLVLRQHLQHGKQKRTVI
ncbi:hypothetical protein GCM10010873_03760 [Cypionkella aquatica]|uniref:O-antigen ligase like membrane protein n=1 Tax=Cypionkella aquatica TaxID=1756042 RepID=A0AA37TT85_9RHOB|nr:hypothetical protein [Cypionkella aquatica]GLS85403.1 hypothetical protein GCM10010873_03760 [Cypionkella aquatica]